MSSKEVNEEILLYTPENDTTSIDEASLNNITAKITQSKKWKQRYKIFCIYDNKILGINDYSGKTIKKFWVNLVHIDPSPSLERFISWKSYLIALLFLATGVLLVTHKAFNLLTNVRFHYQTSVAVSLMTLAILLSLYAAYRSINELKFCTSHGQVAVFSMFRNSPNKKHYKAFLKQLITAIKTAKSKDFYNQSEQLAVELGEHRRLKNEGILSTDDYNKAKSNIMQCH